jgi:hypothetical protein
MRATSKPRKAPQPKFGSQTRPKTGDYKSKRAPLSGRTAYLVTKRPKRKTGKVR